MTAIIDMQSYQPQGLEPVLRHIPVSYASCYSGSGFQCRFSDHTRAIFEALHLGVVARAPSEGNEVYMQRNKFKKGYLAVSADVYCLHSHSLFLPKKRSLAGWDCLEFEP